MGEELGFCSMPRGGSVRSYEQELLPEAIASRSCIPTLNLHDILPLSKPSFWRILASELGLIRRIPVEMVESGH